MMGAREERRRNDERLVDALVEEAQRGVGFISRVQLDEGWERLRAASEPEPRRVAAGRPGARAWLLGFSAAGAVALAALLLHRQNDTPAPVVRFALEGDATAARNVVTTSPGKTARLRFSDASRIELAPSTRLEVTALDARGAQIVLLDGALDVDVRPRADTSWRFTAGRFRVDVKGTSFHLAFDACAATLRLRMTEGQVAVLAPPDRRLAVRAGESLELNDGSVEPVPPAPSAPPSPPASDAEPSLELTLVPAPERPASRPPVRRAATRTSGAGDEPAPAPSWPTLLARGSFAAVVAEAERRGLDAVLAQAPAADLAALADSARYTRRHDLAQKALLTLRARFAGTEPATDAAFFLGRLAEASSGQPDAALAWYDRYLREAPRGLYASETLAREMTLLARGAPERARTVARAYLERFPEGPQAKLARSLLEAE